MRQQHLTDAVTTRRYSIAVTTPARTIADPRRTDSPKVVRRAIRQAEYDRLPIGEAGRATGGTRSDLESSFLRLCRRYRLPKPEVNVPIGRFTVDFLWRDQGLVVETDSYRTHFGTLLRGSAPPRATRTCVRSELPKTPALHGM
jgi:hypothetical protein